MAKATLLGEFNRSVAAGKAAGAIDLDRDAAAIQAGRDLAAQLDFAKENMTGPDLTKALYLMPHVMAILEKLLATPKARQDAKASASTPGTSKVTEMRNANRRRTA